MPGMVQRQLLQTTIDLAPIAAILVFFWARFLRADRRIARRTLVGALHLAAGLTLFRIGLEGTLLPLGSELARSLGEHAVATGNTASFSALVGFAVAFGGAAALIEPTLATTADRVRDLSGGSIRPMVLRVAVATGIGVGLGLGVVRLILGVPLGIILFPLVVLMGLLVVVAPRALVPLALDSGAIATSVVTVPVIAAYGVAVAATIPGRSALADGFGLIVLAMVCSSVTVLATSWLEAHIVRTNVRKFATEEKRP